MTSPLRHASSLALAVLAILASTGCAVDMPVVELYPPESDQGLLRAPSERPAALGLVHRGRDQIDAGPGHGRSARARWRRWTHRAPLAA